jgi:hypothetical protein
MINLGTKSVQQGYWNLSNERRKAILGCGEMKLSDTWVDLGCN